MTGTPTHPSLKAGYVPGIDGLRAYAVLAVILYHFRNAILPGGFTGVDVFFAISGYVVSGSLMKERQEGFWEFARSFYARRILRIYPGLIVCLLITGVLQILFIPLSWLSTTSYKTSVFAFFGLSNFALIFFNDGYFSPRVEFNAYTHTWSLAVEEQFYLLYPAVFFLWRLARNRSGSAAAIGRYLLPVLLFGSLLVAAVQTRSSVEAAYYLLPSRFWELACGAILYMLHSRGHCVIASSAARSASLAIGLGLVATGYVAADPVLFPFPWAAIPVIGALFVIAGVTSAAQGTSAPSILLEHPAVVYVGKISYSLYLWHWPVAVLLRWTVGLEHPLALPSAIVLTAIASVISYHFIERPIRQSRFAAVQSDGYIVSRGMSVIAASTFVALGTFLLQPYLSLSVTKDRANWYHGASSLQMNGSWFTRAPLHSQAVAGRRLFALGDSHAGAYATLFQMLRDQQGMSVQVYTKEACAAGGLLQPVADECGRFITDSVSAIKARSSPGDIVFLASFRSPRIGDQWRIIDEAEVDRLQGTVEAEAQRRAALDEADALVSTLEQAGLVVIIDAPKPLFRSPPFRCSDWFNAGNPICRKGMEVDKDYLKAHFEPVLRSIAKLTSRHPSLVVWDTVPVLCPGKVCSAYDGTLPIFFDCDHLSGHGNRLLYPSFAALLKSIPTSPVGLQKPPAATAHRIAQDGR